MIYLLDADTLIRADSTYYPLRRFPVFWEWLRYHGAAGSIKIPFEQYDEVVAGKGELVDWLKAEEIKVALLFEEDADPILVARVTQIGYGADLNETDVEKIADLCSSRHRR